MIQKIGDSVPLKRGPAKIQPQNPGGGTHQKIGDAAPLKPAPVHLSAWSQPNKGTHEVIGDSVPLKRAPIKGYQGIPMSDRSKEQSR